MRHREPAICLRTTDYSETSQVVRFFTRGVGAVRLLGKGTKRPKSKSGGAIDLLSEGELVFTTSRGEALGVLIEFSETTLHAPLRRDAGRLYPALYMIELVGEMLAESDPHPEVFDLLHNCLVRLGQADAPAPAVLAYFQWRLLSHVGLLGELAACVECGKSPPPSAAKRGELYFSASKGGLLCRDCETAVMEKYRLDGPTLAGLAALQAAQAAKPSAKRITLPDSQAHAVNRLLAYHIREQLGKELKLARHAIPPAGCRRQPE